jgi:hypothetical protein
MGTGPGAPAGSHSGGEIVNRELAYKVANAVLYEGYMLYPYRPSALKNRQRWSFGILYPPDYFEVRGGTERSRMKTECLLESVGNPGLTIELRFLHLMARQVFQVVDHHSEPTHSLSLDGQLIESWDEGVERSAEFEVKVGADTQGFEFNFSASAMTESLCDRTGRLMGSLVRKQEEISGRLLASSKQIQEHLWKLSVDVSNESKAADPSNRATSMRGSLLSAHTILTAKNGSFLSLLDPPENLKGEANACVNVGNFPVLVGTEGERDTMLCSPIVLYDYPQIACESAGDFFDAAEIDEMLTLRLMTLTEDEKQEMRLADDRARTLLERTERNAREQLVRTHGIMRSVRPASNR